MINTPHAYEYGLEPPSLLVALLDTKAVRLLLSMLVSARIRTADMHMTRPPGVNTYHIYQLPLPVLKVWKFSQSLNV